MRSVVVYESMYGNTRAVADAIGRGLGQAGEVVVVPVGRAGGEVIDGADLVVVGGPTHAHGMTRVSTRKAAVQGAGKPGSTLPVDPDAEGPGLREWFSALGTFHAHAAAFDTRIAGPAAFTGRASKGISRSLRHHGFGEVVEPESFLVDKESHLKAGEEARAQEWGRRLSQALTAPSPR